MILQVTVDSKTITFDEHGAMKLKLSSAENQGLSFDSSGNLIATPGSSSGSGIFNIPGNCIGPADNNDMSITLDIVGMNSTVSRHKKYEGQSEFIRANDGVVISKLSGNTIASDCVAYYMINAGGGQ